jgi:hypothetical protein
MRPDDTKDVIAPELGAVIVKRGHGEPAMAHETMALRGVARANAVNFKVNHRGLAHIIRQDAQDRMQRPHPAQASSSPAHGFGPWEIADDLFKLFSHDFGCGAPRTGDGRVIDLTLFLVAHLKLIARNSGPAQKALNRLFRRIDAGAFALFAGRGAGGQQTLNRKRKTARRGKTGGPAIGQASLDKRIGHAFLEVFGRTRLHAGRDFLGKKFDQKIWHITQYPLGGSGQSSGARCPSKTTAPQRLI